MGCSGNEQRKLKKKIEELDCRFDVIKKETNEKLLEKDKEIKILKDLTEELKTKLGGVDVDKTIKDLEESNQKIKEELKQNINEIIKKNEELEKIQKEFNDFKSQNNSSNEEMKQKIENLNNELKNYKELEQKNKEEIENLKKIIEIKLEKKEQDSTTNCFTGKNTSKSYPNIFNQGVKQFNFPTDPKIIKLVDTPNYMNTILLCLLNTKKLVKYFIENENNINMNLLLSYELNKIINDIWKKGNTEIFIENFKNAFWVKNNTYQDNEELSPKDFLESLINIIHDELSNNNTNSIVSNLFNISFQVINECQNGHYSNEYKIFRIIEFKMSELSKLQTDGSIDINKCFEQIPKQQYGEKICQFCNIYKKLYKASPYLIIYVNWENDFSKTKLIFPENLNLNKYFINKDINTNYELYGVVIRFGDDYNVYIKNFIDKKWYYYFNGIGAEQNIFKIDCIWQNKMSHLLFYKSNTDDF